MTQEIEYAWAKGVLNTAVKGEACTFATMVKKHRVAVEVDATADEYAAMNKREKGDIKKTLPYFVGGVVEGKRDDENVKARTLLTLDIERNPKLQATEPPPPQQVLDELEALGHAGWVYTTMSHTEDAPRYRVVLPLLAPLVGKEALKASTKKAAKALGVDAWCQDESWALSQPMYLPAKLRGGTCWQRSTTGKAWKPAPADIPEGRVVADIPEGKLDPVLLALQAARLYLGEDKGHPGKHYITCPFHEEHGAVNDTQTVYFEAHHNGHKTPNVKCFDTEPDVGGKPHLTHSKLKSWLTENDHLDEPVVAQADEDFEAFDQGAQVGQYLEAPPEARDWAWEQFAPIGKVTVLAGPGGVSKSMFMLHLLVHGALGEAFADIKPAKRKPVRALYVSYEDDRQELHKRVYTLANALREKDDGFAELLYDVNGEIGKNLRLFAVDDSLQNWLLMDKADRHSPAEPTSRVKWLIGYLRAKKMRALVLDPAVYTHRLEESDNGDMAFLMRTLTYIAKEAGVAVVVLHHMAKVATWAQLEDIHQGSLRGASAFADNARSVAVLVTLPAKDAATYGLSKEDAKRYAVLKHVKHNYSASLGERVLLREDACLVHRKDIQPLSAAEAKQALEQQQEGTHAEKLVAQAEKAMRWLAENGGEAATQNTMEGMLGMRRGAIKFAMEKALGLGWVKFEPGANRSKMWQLTDEGQKHVDMRKREAAKGKAK